MRFFNKTLTSHDVNEMKMIKTYSREGKNGIDSIREQYKKKCEQQTPDEDHDVEKL